MAFIEVLDLQNPIVLTAAGALVRRAFLTVAEEFQLTRFNCPSQPAFQSDEALADRVARHNCLCFGAYEKNRTTGEKELVGFAMLRSLRRQVAELERLCVAPEHRHHETGAFLVEYAMGYAKKLGHRQLRVCIMNENIRLKTWYRAHGFVPLRLKTYPQLPFTVCEMEHTV